MLATPGSSPRHLPPPPSPSPSGGDGRAVVPASHSSNGLMGPPPPKKPRKQVVLDEDTYVAAIEKIVERDFFPDIPKLQNRLEWLEAVRTGDPVVIREAQLKIIQRRADRAREATPSLAGTPATGFRTPASMMGGVSPAMSLRSQDLGLGLQDAAGGGGDSQKLPDINMPLDTFLRKYTSEDNASFAEIKKKDDDQRRAKAFRQLSKDQVAEQLRVSETGEADEGERNTDGYGSSGQSVGTLVSWDYKGKNLLMYDSSNRPDAPLSQQELDERAKGPPKEVVRRNTRFHGKVFNGRQGEDETVAILYTPVPGGTPMPFAERDAAKARQHYDLEDLRRTPTGVQGSRESYSMVHTPSPAPGVDESPFMTWGEIEGTPIRLEAEDTPIGIGGSVDGPHFKIHAQPARDEAAHSMSRSAARSLRERNQHKGFGSPSPANHSTPGHGIATPAAGGLSAAAQKLVSKALKRNRAAVDQNLRASYGGGTPGRSPSAARLREGSLPLHSPSASPSFRGSLMKGPTPSAAGCK